LQTSSTYWAQGGIASAIDEEDSPLLHFEDTIIAGRGLCNKDAVSILVNEGPIRINELISAGLGFDKLGDHYALGLEGGHSRRRVLHLGGNETGKFIVDFLSSKIKESENITVYENFLVHKLLIDDNICSGCYAYSWNDKTDYTFKADIVLLATGGGAGIYKRSTNPHSSIGDGITLAYNSGIDVVNMEFIQFHPTALYLSSGETFLITEAVRGEGAYLLDSSGNRFMKNIHELAELAPRDVVSKGIFKVMSEQKIENVFLSLAHLDKNKIKKRFKNIYETSLKYGIDITRDLVPVAPAAHYLVGGINTGLNGETIFQGLYASGEVSYTGVHGANRLASNSLLECLVFSYRAIEDSKKLLGKNKINLPLESYKYLTKEELNTKYLRLKNEFLGIMNKNVGIVRNRKSLEEALEFINNIDADWDYIENEYYSDRLKSLKTVAALIINGAIYREESRGCHIRTDFPGENNILYDVNQSLKTGITRKEL
ncbi:MAG: L-aspartate oxidase, partial [Ignavibacteriales bacterium]